MTFKNFSDWCNLRAADGCWDMTSALACTEILNKVRQKPFWKREKVWKQLYEKSVVDNIVIPIENKIKEVYEK